MSSTALIVMIVAMIAIWGGLILSSIHLIKNPDIDLDKVPADH
ncbi:methionine/alanine import family NSS transporter small subunit [Moraxella sp. FZLJ2107]|nr:MULTISPECIES: methionine/alanine import family NSS transporter small subunit [unclassified Moraxella]USZ14501.1 methionine/alanine import family NSS transporter small subunit [Moraxella sp. FZFQ2102]UTO05174.1 methionine/alanine import family NSS transporter small subunit [Moraxella sp. FZLJ2107]UTO21909.1 methionine/alanine import family NSS transporter small subunit [Moraxella sp. FZLJ2109]